MLGGVRNCWAEAAAVDRGVATGDCGGWYVAMPSAAVNAAAEEVVVVANGVTVVGWKPPLFVVVTVGGEGGWMGVGMVGTMAIISASLCLR